jgi:hypothetical protein
MKYGRCGVYLLIGQHTSGSWAFYIGTSKNVYCRLRSHHQIIEALFDKTRDPSWSKALHCHRVLSQPGWTVHYRSLAFFSPKVYFVFAYLLEAVLIFMFASLDESAVARKQPSLVHLITDLDGGFFRTSNATASPYLRLNRASPLSQQVNGADEREKRCSNCNETETFP